MKYIIILGDGMADLPIEQLDNKTPLEYAKTPEMDRLSKLSEIGLVSTIPDGMKPGSDTANLSVLGYNPEIYYSGRSPLEALSIGVDMKDTDVALRANLVTLEGDDKPFEEKIISDHSSGEISTEDAAKLIECIKKELETEKYKFYVGTSYRHLVIWDKGEVIELAQPHDHLGKKIGEFLPTQPDLKEIMKKSYELLKNHPINIDRIEKGLNPANSLWFWGAGTKPKVSSFEEKTGKKGAMISAVDLLKGIAVGTKMKNIFVEGANATLHTNYEGKAQAAVDALLKDNIEFVYVHVEAPDEMGHQGSYERKVQSIEFLDQRVIAPICKKMDESGEDYRMMIIPDHPTPVSIRTHSSDPVPFLIYDSRNPLNNKWNYNEREASESNLFIEKGYTIIDRLLQINQ